MSDLVVYIKRNHIEVVRLKDGESVQGNADFSTARLLVGQFKVAEELLAGLVKQVKTRGFFAVMPRLLIQPLEMTEGGLSEVETRVLMELGESAGARFVQIKLGAMLNREGAAAAFRSPA